jgi:hypothetical protein
LLSGRYLNGIPEGLASFPEQTSESNLINEQTIGYIKALNEVAQKRGTDFGKDVTCLGSCENNSCHQRIVWRQQR